MAAAGIELQTQRIINFYIKDLYANHYTTKMASKLICKLSEETHGLTLNIYELSEKKIRKVGQKVMRKNIKLSYSGT
jgi:hypothetical protein